MTTYTPTIGLEVHAELKTKTKMFCNSKNDSDETEPNINICPVCMAHPGTLPVINREAVKHVLTVGVALGGELADYTEFDRKNYFYPDIPKGYQISQYEFPLVSGGSLAGVEITRVHLEEDTASSMHDSSGATTIDFNRAGVPLMELVTEPVMHSAEDAGRFARELQLLLRYLGVSDANMEKGEMRVEANISVSDTDELGTKVEVKNINSFRAVERAIAHEVKRQIALLEKGEAVQQQTRGWDENKQETFQQRIKEGSADYRYFPDPDLPKLRISALADFAHENLAAQMPELPWQRRERYVQLGLKEESADLLVRERELGDFFDAVLEAFDSTGQDSLLLLASNYIGTDYAKLLRDHHERDTESRNISPVSATRFASLMKLIHDSKVSSRGGKDILAALFEHDDDPSVIAKQKGLFQASGEGELQPIVERIVSDNPSVVDEYRGGKDAALQFLVGQGMKESKGSANPQVLKELIIKYIS